MPAGDPSLVRVQGFPAPDGPLELDVRAGDVVLLRGPNGSGKTSLLRQVAGLDAPLRAPVVEVGGQDPRTLPAADLARRVRALWSDPRAALVGLTVEGEGRLRGIDVPAGVGPLRERDIATLSSGEARRVALAFAAAAPAPVLLLDEPCIGLDADGLRALDAVVADARGRGAVIAVDHTGHLARAATRTVDLAPMETAAWATDLSTGATPILRSTAATVRLGRQDLRLPGATWTPGLHAVAGRNGAGKSTLLRRLAGLADSQGVVIADAQPQPGHNVTLLMPDASGLFTADTVRSELEGCRDEDGLVPPRLLDRHPLSLSAGEGQRVALAKALGRALPVHLLDEPEAHLDGDGLRRLSAALSRRVAAGACIVLATHDPALAAAAATRMALP